MRMKAPITGYCAVTFLIINHILSHQSRVMSSSNCWGYEPGSDGVRDLPSRVLWLVHLHNIGFLAGLWATLVVHRCVLVHMEVHPKVKQDHEDQSRPVRDGFHTRHTLHGKGVQGSTNGVALLARYADHLQFRTLRTLSQDLLAQCLDD